MTTIAEPHLVITLIDRAPSTDAGCRDCSTMQYEITRSRRKCYNCGSLHRRQEGAIYRQTVLVDPELWPMKNTTVERADYDRIRAQVSAGQKPKVFKLDQNRS